MKDVRLPKYLRPERYKLIIKPNLESFIFEGEEVIDLVLDKAVSEIVLHSKDLKVAEAFFITSDRKNKAKKIAYDKKAETVRFSFLKKIEKGRGQLHLKFTGILNEHMRGFYRSRYVYNNQEKHLATTQFEATDARRAFPCFDEPGAKAVFDVTIMVPRGLTAISNTIESSVSEHESGYKVVQFAPTPKMSTYLLAFIVGDFEYIEKTTKRGVKVRVFVTPGKKHQAHFALDCGVKILEFYEKYFDINYPLPILDMVAIPDFSHGAMENWGAVTYRESALLVDPKHSSASNKQWVALVIAHELAHQWFGNLVTMHWWTDLWLNEGFASYIEYLAVNQLFPHWDIWTQFAYADLGIALRLDGLKSTHPIEIKVHHPDEIGEIFDEVSYSKGASIIRMLADFLGEKDFRDGLRFYLKKHSYGNTITTDLWDALEKVSKKPVKKIMEAWTKLPGYPVLKVVQKTRGVKLSQSRYYSSILSKNLSKDKSLWNVPIKYKKLNSKKHQKLLFTEKSKDYNSIEYEDKLPIKLNSGESGFYRVDYPAQILNSFKPWIKSQKLPPIDRLGLIRDSFALSESQELPTTQALELCFSYINENDYTVWTEISSGLNLVYQLIYNQPFVKQYENFARKIFEGRATILGFKSKKGESHTTSLLRSLILNNFGTFGDIGSIKTAKQMFLQKHVGPDVRSVVYQLVAKNGGTAEYNKFIEKYKQETLNEEKNRLGYALASFKDKKILKNVLKFSLSTHVRLQDAPTIISGVISNPAGRILGFEFIKKNWKELNKRYPSSGHMLGRMLKPLGLFSTQKDLENLKQFFKGQRTEGIKRAIEQILERVESNANWLEKQKNLIESWLEKNNK